MGIGFLKKTIKLAKIIQNSDYRRALLKGVTAAVEHERLLSTLDCKTVIDIGANRSQFALVARNCFPKARIISYEPLPKPSKFFQTVFAKDPNVILYPVAIGPQTMSAKIHISRQDDSSSLLSITPLQEAMFPGTAEKGTETISVEPLSKRVTKAEIAAPALLKLDVQGYEFEALKGCVDLLNLFDYVYVECSFVELYTGQALVDKVISFLYEQNLKLQGIYNTFYDSVGLAIQADFLFYSIKKATV